MKVVISRRFGGFGLSQAAYDWLIANRGWTVTTWQGGQPKDPNAQLISRNADKVSEALERLTRAKYSLHIDGESSIKFRSSEPLIAVVEALGQKANGRYAELEIVEIDDDAIKPYIDEYDGYESIREGRSW